MPPSYRSRLAASLLALGLFLAVYVGLMAWLLDRLWTLWEFGVAALLIGGAPLLLLLAFLASGLFAITRRSYGDFAVELTPDREPTLFAFLHRVADEAGAPRPHRVYVVPDITAAVAYDLAAWNLILPTRKNLLIGLGLVNALTLDEFKAVLAHEFGHFSQRSTQVSSYTYVAMQITGHVIGHRGRIDGFLHGLSYMDLRIAWIGWILRVIVWSVRSVLDALFRLVLRSQRALSREMEFQADLVAVRIAGSDSIVHALSRLEAADEASNLAASFLHAGAADGRRCVDLYTLQTSAFDWLRKVRGDPGWGTPRPAASGVAGAEHRVFTLHTATTPQMWATHPSSRDREDNAKRRYVASTLDPRSPWLLFADADALRREMTKRLVDQVSTEGEPDDLLAKLAEVYGAPHAAQRFQGSWIGWSSARAVRDPSELTGPCDDLDRTSITEALQASYPPALSDLLRTHRETCDERAQLEGLRDGFLEAPGGVVRFRGRELGRDALTEVIAEVRADQGRAEDAILAHDVSARTACRRAALVIGRGWPEHHDALVRLLHLLEHAGSDIEDAHGALHHVLRVVLADGQVSGSERSRVLAAALVANVALRDVRALAVVLRPPVTDEAVAFDRALPDASGFPGPTSANLGEWLPIFDRWVVAVSGSLRSLRTRTVSALIAAEDTIAAAYLADDGAVAIAPEPVHLPETWPVRPDGTERPRVDKIGWWDRFQLADGPGPAVARFGVAAGILVAATSGVMWVTPDPRVVLVNGLQVPVVVTVSGESALTLEPSGRGELFVDPGPHDVEVTARGEVVLRQAFDVSRSSGVIVGVGCGWVQADIVYGDGPTPQPPQFVGDDAVLKDRWSYVAEDPPRQIDVGKAKYATRTLLTCDGEPWNDAGAAGLHVRHDSRDRVDAWLPLLDPTVAWETLRARPDFAEVRLAAVASSERSLAHGACEGLDTPSTPAEVLAAAACRTPGPDRDAAIVSAAEGIREDPYARVLAANALMRQERWADAASWTEAPLARYALWRVRILRRAALPAPLATPGLADLLNAEAGVPGPCEMPGLCALARGDLATPSERGEPMADEHTVFVGASVGADAPQVRRAVAKAPSLESDLARWFGAALILRETGALPDPLREQLRASSTADVVLPLLDEGGLHPDLVQARARLATPIERGLVYGVAAVALGPAAPAAYLDEARALLLPWERPYLGPHAPAAAPR